MNFNDKITLNAYSESANKQFDEVSSRLSKIESSFQSRMNGKTIGGIVGSIVGTLAWLAVYITCAVFAKPMVNGTLLTITMIVALGLIAFMLIDNILNYLYYGKISNYKNSISQLQNRVSVGKNSIKSNYDAFMASKAKGWNFILNSASSIPDEATSIESTMANMESLKSGFLNGAKNAFYYVAVVMITVAGCMALFPTGGEIMTGISGESISSDTIMVLNVIAMILVCVGVVILAKLLWSKTDCTVTNVTLFITLLGPVAFLALIAIATLIVLLVVGIVSVLLAILAVVAVVACICAGISGG